MYKNRSARLLRLPSATRSTFVAATAAFLWLAGAGISAAAPQPPTPDPGPRPAPTPDSRVEAGSTGDGVDPCPIVGPGFPLCFPGNPQVGAPGPAIAADGRMLNHNETLVRARR